MHYFGIYCLGRGWTRKRSGSTISRWLCCCNSPAETPSSLADASPWPCAQSCSSRSPLAVVSSDSALTSRFPPGFKPLGEKRNYRDNAARLSGAAEEKTIFAWRSHLCVGKGGSSSFPSRRFGVNRGPVKLQGFGLTVRRSAASRGFEGGKASYNWDGPEKVTFRIYSEIN